MIIQTVFSRKLALVLIANSVFSLPLHAATGSRDGRLLVKWKDGPESYAAAVGNASIGSTVKRNFNAIGWQHLELPPRMSVRDGMNAYQELGTVLAVEADGIIEPILPPERGLQPASPDDELEGQATGEGNSSDHTTLKRTKVRAHTPPPPPVLPNDPMFSQQWYLNKISATNAWNTITGSSNVVVAIIDSGVDYTHPDLAPNMWRNPGETGVDDQGRDKANNGIDDDNNGYVDDLHGADIVKGTGDPMDIGFWFPPDQPADAIYHGTFIAGLIGAVANNATGIAGLNWSIQIMAVRLIGGDYSDPRNFQFTDSITIASWDYVVMMKRAREAMNLN